VLREVFSKNSLITLSNTLDFVISTSFKLAGINSAVSNNTKHWNMLNTHSPSLFQRRKLFPSVPNVCCKVLSFWQIYCCLGLLAILNRLYRVDADTLGWWLCERQLPSGGLNGNGVIYFNYYGMEYKVAAIVIDIILNCNKI